MSKAGSEALDSESPRFEEVGGGEAAPETSSGAGRAPIEEEEEEEEQKDRDTHFKWKRKKPELKEPAPKEFTKQKATQKEPHKKQVVKRARQEI